MAKKLKNDIYRNRLKQIRGYVNFNYDLRKNLTPQQKRKITIYYEEISSLLKRPAATIYRPRNKSHLKPAQKFGQHTKNLKDLKIAVIQKFDKSQRVKFTKKGKLRLTQFNVRIKHIELNQEKLAINPKGYIEKVIKPFNEKARFQINAGIHEVPNSASKSTIVSEISKLMSKYSIVDKNNYWVNWLDSMKAYEFENGASVKEYLAAKNKKRREGRKRVKKNDSRSRLRN